MPTLSQRVGDLEVSIGQLFESNGQLMDEVSRLRALVERLLWECAGGSQENTHPPDWERDALRARNDDLLLENMKLESEIKRFTTAMTLDAQPKAPKRKSGKPLKDFLFRTGKCAGRTFENVAREDPGYCKWVMEKTFEADSALGKFQEFLKFLPAERQAEA